VSRKKAVTTIRGLSAIRLCREGGEKREKYYVDGGQVEIAAHLVYELDPNGKQLQVVKYTDYTASKVRTLFPNAADLRKKWADPACRSEIIEALAQRELSSMSWPMPQSNPMPIRSICFAISPSTLPFRTRRERADRLKKDRKDFFDKYAPEARGILEELLEKYTQHGTAQFVIPDILKVPPLSEMATSWRSRECLAAWISCVKRLWNCRRCFTRLHDLADYGKGNPSIRWQETTNKRINPNHGTATRQPY